LYCTSGAGEVFLLRDVEELGGGFDTTTKELLDWRLSSSAVDERLCKKYRGCKKKKYLFLLGLIWRRSPWTIESCTTGDIALSLFSSSTAYLG